MRLGAALLLAALPLWGANNDARFFDERVAPILEKRCLPCHNDQLKNGDISFENRASLLHGGPHGPAIVPGHPESSFLMNALRHEGEIQMPPGPQLPSKEISLLRQWIKRGAIWGSRLRK
ncbi:MAG TPA: c-type cytochrome domain-containing protein [Bryobacteraceae bacterium]|nr:c-type cytochrome domain-containing protein [Bryobacteraceae bacterium]